MFKEIVLLALAFVCYTQAGTADIGIVHYNDIYGQLQKFKSGSKPPVACGENEQRCSGGVAELAAHIKKIEENDFQTIGNSSKLRFAVGNLISGENGWIRLIDDNYNSDGWKQYGELLSDSLSYIYHNYYRPSAAALGPRDFDGGLEKVNNYVGGMKGIKPVVSNVDCRLSRESVDVTQEQSFCTNSSQTYQIIITETIKIGVVGYVDPIVYHQSEPGNLAFQNTVASLKQTIVNLLAQNNDVKVIFAIGTGSLDLAKFIIDEIPEIKLVLYGGGKNSEIPDEYPLKHKSSYIATAHKYGETLGKLMLQIDDTNGNIVKVVGSELVKNDYTNPIDAASTQMQTTVTSMAKKAESGNKEIGVTKVKLEGSVSACWKKECVLGDLITDSMVHCAFNKKDFEASGDMISLWHSSGISGGIKLSDSEIKIVDVHKWLAYNNMATVVSMKGGLLRQMFTASAQALAEDSEAPKWGQFLQVSSGVEVRYNILNRTTVQPEVRIAKLNNEGQLQFQSLDDGQLYWVVLPSFLYNGRNAYHFLPKQFELIGNTNSDKVDIDMDYKCMENYIKALGTVILGHEQRIFVNDPNGEVETTTAAPNPSSSTTINPNPTTTTQPTDPNQPRSGDSYSKFEVATISVASTLLVVALVVVAVFVFLRYRTPRIPHQRASFNSYSPSVNSFASTTKA